MEKLYNYIDKIFSIIRMCISLSSAIHLNIVLENIDKNIISNNDYMCTIIVCIFNYLVVLLYLGIFIGNFNIEIIKIVQLPLVAFMIITGTILFSNKDTICKINTEQYYMAIFVYFIMHLVNTVIGIGLFVLGYYEYKRKSELELQEDGNRISSNRLSTIVPINSIV